MAKITLKGDLIATVKETVDELAEKIDSKIHIGMPFIKVNGYFGGEMLIRIEEILTAIDTIE